eukprot:Plantae.Rhodophyta-Palmaria_palmata.ctg2465.p1 GENE.Plantae.Rhodophyta-Palmaria_palmata.ctg2465~~Plantae.Rhodophyta-Palmaria_palmata.ctg2465.p1  ORF type:complete len:263 (+),score=36.38 Plantae.Rhodophyta-Palmaria_palmata.ctg2465:561-1349(+)
MAVALAQAARFYIYGRHHISKSTFDDPAFRDMLRAHYEAGGGKGTMKYLNWKGLIYGEFRLFKLSLKHLIAEAGDVAFGNKFGQGLHDEGSIFDKRKRLAIGIQLIDTQWEKNHFICLGMTPLSTDAADPTSQVFRNVSREQMGAEYDAFIAFMCQDLAATAVVRAMEQASDDCDMHQVSKISKSAVGTLVVSRGKELVNPFPEGVGVMNKSHNAGKHFSYSTRHDELTLLCLQVDSARMRIKLDVNGTQITAKHCLLVSLI